MPIFKIVMDPSGKLGAVLAPQFSGGEVLISPDTLRVTFGDPPAFDVTILRSNIAQVERMPDLKGASRGVHGHRGKWLVNGSGSNLVRLHLNEAAGAATNFQTEMIEGWREPKNRLVRAVLHRLIRPKTIQVRELTISVESPEEFMRAVS